MLGEVTLSTGTWTPVNVGVGWKVYAYSVYCTQTQYPSTMARYSPPKDVPPLTRAELRKLWVEYPCPTVRRLLLEIKRLRMRTVHAYNYMQLLMDRQNWQTVDRAIHTRSIDAFLRELYEEAAVREGKK